MSQSTMSTPTRNFPPVYVYLYVQIYWYNAGLVYPSYPQTSKTIQATYYVIPDALTFTIIIQR
jgi:hypothetical protein